MRRLALAMGLLALSGCAVGPNYRAPKPLADKDVALREAASNPTVTAVAVADPHWWRLFDDPQLDRLVDKALLHNTDIRVATANVRRARALLSEARAGFLPTTTASAQVQERRFNPAASGIPGAGAFETEFYTLGFDASYEVDLFGRVSRSAEAAKADFAAAGAALDAARVSIAAETARTYASMCGFAFQAASAQETAQLQQKTLDLTERLLQGGRGTRRDVDQAVVLVEQARANAATFESERRASLYALAVLTGEPPAAIDPAIANCAALPTVTRPIPVGDGRALLSRRPDVRQAERQLAADTARVGVATAALYPSITLLGSIGTASTNVRDLDSSRALTWSIGPLISWNFPFSGAARARVRQSEATAAGSLASFDKAVLTALQETEQALARLAGALDRETSLKRALDASNSAAFVAEKRFGAGSDSFLQLLDAQRSRASARAALASAQSDRAEAQVALFKALGGGWENAPEPVRAP